jgi:hypothetical protein
LSGGVHHNGSRGKVPGKRKPVIREQHDCGDDDDDDNRHYYFFWYSV